MCMKLGMCSATGTSSIAVRLGDRSTRSNVLNWASYDATRARLSMEKGRVHHESEHGKELMEDAEARSMIHLGTLHDERQR